MTRCPKSRIIPALATKPLLMPLGPSPARHLKENPMGAKAPQHPPKDKSHILPSGRPIVSPPPPPKKYVKFPTMEELQRLDKIAEENSRILLVDTETFKRLKASHPTK